MLLQPLWGFYSNEYPTLLDSNYLQKKKIIHSILIRYDKSIKDFCYTNQCNEKLINVSYTKQQAIKLGTKYVLGNTIIILVKNIKKIGIQFF